MDFGLSEEQSLLQDALRGFLADKLPMDRVRTVYEGGDGCLEGLAGELATQGLCGVLVPADSGGSGLGLLDAAVAAEGIPAVALEMRELTLFAAQALHCKYLADAFFCGGGRGGASLAALAAAPTHHACKEKCGE